MLPLKSGADLYNQEAARMRLHNLGADPTEVGAGLIYYNTSSGLSTSQQIRFHTGTAWKTLAFAEDLDVASNADFLALKTKVDAFLEGGVDSDGVLENLKEIQAFLDNYSSATDLSEILDTKLDKTGGTIEGSKAELLNINSTSTWVGMNFSINGARKVQMGWDTSAGAFIYNLASKKSIGVKDDGTPHYSGNTLLHFGNYSDYALPLTGGTIEGNLMTRSHLVTHEVYPGSDDTYELGNNSRRWANIKTVLINGGTPIHSGNYSDYALPKSGGTIEGTGIQPLLIKSSNESSSAIKFITSDNSSITFGYKKGSGLFCTNENGWSQEYTLIHSGNIGEYKAGDSDKLGGVSASSYVAPKTISGDLNATDLYKSQSFVLSLNSSAQNVPSGMNSGEGIYIAGYDTGFMLLSSYTQDKLMYRRGSNSLGSNSILSNGWKTIAFTDSTVDKAKALVSDEGKPLIYKNADNGHFYVGDNLGTKETYILGNAVKLRYGAEATYGFILNSSGNVTIGNQDLAGDYHKLYVSGHSRFVGNIDIYSGGKIQTYGYPLIINDEGNNVLIGTTTDNGSGAKLHVNGNKVAVVQDTNAEMQIYVKNSDARIGILLGSNGHRGFYDFTKNSWVIATDGTKTWLDTGNVGIGTDNPTTKLEVAGVVTLPLNNQIQWKDTGAMIYGTANSTIQMVGTVKTNASLEVGNNFGVINNANFGGDVHIKGNLVVDGEVSAGGAGTEGGNAGGGSGAFYSTTIATQTTSKAIAHNLGTEDIVVSIYEKNGTSGNWEMILTDVEIEDANNIVVSFGSATNVEHKIVIMGAVA